MSKTRTKTRTITGTTQAWISEYSSIGPEELRGDPQHVISGLSFVDFKHGRADYVPKGYTFVGYATITVEAVDDDTLLANKVDSLRAELQSVRAEAEKKATEIETKIQKLLAIGFDAPVEIED